MIWRNEPSFPKPFIIWLLRALAEGKGALYQGVDFHIDPGESSREARLRRSGALWIKGDQGGTKDPGIQTGEDPSHFPAVGGDHIAMGSGWSEEQALAAKAPKVVAGLAGTVGLLGQLRDAAADVLIAEAVDQVSEEGQGKHHGHDAWIAET